MDSSVSNSSTITPNSYFEHSWSILSSIGLFATVMSMFVICMTSLTLLTVVPVVVSVACAVANGLCYYAFYTTYAIKSRMAASIIADLTWVVSVLKIIIKSGIFNNNTWRKFTRSRKSDCHSMPIRY